MKYPILLVFMVVFTLCVYTGPVTGQSPYPEILQVDLPIQTTFYNFTATANNMTIQRSFAIKEFRDVTFADVLLEQTGQLIAKVTITAQINGVNATNVHQESTLFDQEDALFILDDSAKLLPKETNILTFTITVDFKEPAVWEVFQHQYYSVRLDAIAIKTAYRQDVSVESSLLNQSNSRFTALIMNPEYQIATQGALLGNKSNVFSLYAYQLPFYIILPKNIKSNYYLNISFTFNLGFSIRSINIGNFGLVSSSKTKDGISYTFRYIKNDPSNQSLIKGMMQFNPKANGIYHVGIQGDFFITKNYKIWPGSAEMDLFLFINATLIIPLLVLSKLLYRRLFS